MADPERRAPPLLCSSPFYAAIPEMDEPTHERSALSLAEAVTLSPARRFRTGVQKRTPGVAGGAGFVHRPTGNHTLNGFSGTDVLVRGSGTNALIGGTSLDTVVFNRSVTPHTLDTTTYSGMRTIRSSSMARSLSPFDAANCRNARSRSPARTQPSPSMRATGSSSRPGTVWSSTAPMGGKPPSIPSPSRGYADGGGLHRGGRGFGLFSDLRHRDRSRRRERRAPSADSGGLTRRRASGQEACRG
ncbi:hypothetical protein MBUL_00164 [Methylobacterium bullatum]|uniref:Uncharacterized protein n=1 Tax=Methylobacterium bullatum TaxID=570505 RepID=A0A679ITB7_9HYPH|nr:hypothetical protein MBUL_00164 [Methylobacterium bullatum]